MKILLIEDEVNVASFIKKGFEEMYPEDIVLILNAPKSKVKPKPG